MSIEGLVVTEAMAHIEQFGFVKGMDPMALHILKTSSNPTVRAMRRWMRETALKQALEAEREQKKMNGELRDERYSKKSSLRRSAVIHPYYVGKASKQGHYFADKDFKGYVRRENPKVFPQREAL